MPKKRKNLSRYRGERLERVGEGREREGKYGDEREII